jgi:inositol phosphorylceramide synthase catalytic subunit
MKYVFSFGILCFVSVGVQYLIPTPPPWMLAEPQLPPEAFFYRVDSLIGFKLFNSIYSKSPLVCGAFPSLHCAWPVLILCIKPWFSKHLCRFHVFAISFAASYSWHHYFIDIIFGLLFGWLSALFGSFVIDSNKNYIQLNSNINNINNDNDDSVGLVEIEIDDNTNDD